jgi:hypothetical protein
VITAKWVGNQNISSVGTLSLDGAAKANYTLSGSTGIVAVSQKAITVTAPALSKVYDSGLTASGSATVGALAAGESIKVAAVLAFLDRNVGNGNKTVRASGLSIQDVSGADVTANYSVNYTDNVVSTIIAKPLILSGLSSASKVYDGTTTAVASGTAVLQAAIAATAGTSTDGKPYLGDDVSLAGTATAIFNSKDVATANQVTFGGLSLAGTGSANYTLSSIVTNSPRITPRVLTVASTIASKSYDGTTTPGAVNVGTVTGLLGNEKLVVTATAVAYQSALAGTYPGVTINYTLADGSSGGLASNYLLTSGSATGLIVGESKILSGSGTEAIQVSGGLDLSVSGNASQSGIISGNGALNLLFQSSKDNGETGKQYICSYLSTTTNENSHV